MNTNFRLLWTIFENNSISSYAHGNIINTHFQHQLTLFGWNTNNNLVVGNIGLELFYTVIHHNKIDIGQKILFHKLCKCNHEGWTETAIVQSFQPLARDMRKFVLHQIIFWKIDAQCCQGVD